MNNKFQGTLYAIIAAISYGMNPLGALFLYQEGVNTFSVLFYRFFLAAMILGGILLLQKKSFKVTTKELLVFSSLGVLFAISALTLFSSFLYMDAGVASTILFIYPVMVAILMSILFREKITIITILSIFSALAGLLLLYQGDGETTLSTVGVLLVMVSSLTYAIYIVVINKSSLTTSSVKMTFFVLIFCVLSIIICSFWGGDSTRIKLLPNISAWLWAIMLAVVPTIISLITMTKAIHLIGATPTSIIGALEPVTAVFVGVIVFNEIFTPRLALGILLILAGVIIVIAGRSFNTSLVIASLNDAGRKLKKYFRWR